MTSAAAEGLRCANCGAAVARASARFCEYCGKALPETAARPPSPDELLERRFQELENHPELQRHLRWTPGPDVTALGMSRGMAALAVAFLVFFLVPGVSHGPVRILPILVGTIVLSVVWRNRHLAAPLERLVAVVSDERRDASGNGGARRRTCYHATLETRDGARREFEVSGRLAGEIRPGDMGVGYVKGGVLVAFQRLRP